MNSRKPQGPRIVIDFSEEFARRLTAEQIKEALKELLVEEGLLDAHDIAGMFKISVMEFNRTHAKKLPVVNLSERVKRYRFKDVIAYCDKKTVLPRS